MRWLSSILLVSLAVTGCNDTRRITPGRDGGHVEPPPFDGGHAVDSGHIVIQPDGGNCTAENSTSTCGDFRDNDCDGQMDCNDNGCCAFVTCPAGTLCGDVPRDAGTIRRDAGPALCGSVSGVVPLPASCVPRCRTFTRTQFDACTTNQCWIDGMTADTTPSVTLGLTGGAAPTAEIDCIQCGYWQQGACINMYCPTEYNALLACDPTTDPLMCQDQVDAVNACLNGPSVTTPYTTCFTTQMHRCFP